MTRHEYETIVREEKEKVRLETVAVLEVCTLAGASLQKAQAFLERGLDARAVMRELAAEGGYDLRSQLVNSEDAAPADPRNVLLVDAENRQKAAAEAMAAEAVSKYKQ